MSENINSTTTTETNSKSTTKKTVTRKASTRKTGVKKETSTAKKDQVNIIEFKKDDLIPCMSVTVGHLIYSALDTRSHNRYDWFDFGDVCEVEYQDLLAMIARKSEYLFTPRIVVNSDSFLEKYPKLKELKEKFFGLDDTNKFFDVSPEMLEEKIISAPEGLKTAIADMAGSLIKSGELDSRRKIEVIDKTLGTEFGKLIG